MPLLTPGSRLAAAPGPRVDPATRVRRTRPAPARYHRVRRSRTPTPSSACGSPAGSPPQALAEVGRHIAPGVTTDELDRVGHEFLCRPRRLPLDAGLQGLPEVAVHLGQRGDLPRHPGQHRAARRRHRQHRHHGLHRRRPRRHRCHLPRRRRRRGVRLLVERTREALTRGRSRRSRPGAPDQRGRPGDRVLRPALRLRRRPRLHRARHRHVLPLRAGHSRTTTTRAYDHRDGARHDLHDRADAHPRHHRVARCGTTAGPS